MLALAGRTGAQTTLDTAVNFTVKDVNGITHRLNEYLEQGKMVLIDFFTITCGPCVTYAPEIDAAYRDFGCNGSDVIFLGINWGANNQQVINFGNTYGAHYPAVSGLEGNGNHVVADYQVISYPTVILIEPNWAITENYIWPPSQQHIDSVLSAHGALPAVCNTGINGHMKQLKGNLITNVYPNPSAGYVTIETTMQGEGELVILNATGQLADRLEIRGNTSGKIVMQVSGLRAGYYHLILRQGGTIVGNSSLVLSLKD